jgi:hypothetical protein
MKRPRLATLALLLMAGTAAAQSTGLLVRNETITIPAHSTGFLTFACQRNRGDLEVISQSYAFTLSDLRRCHPEQSLVSATPTYDDGTPESSAPIGYTFVVQNDGDCPVQFTGYISCLQ